MPHDLSSPGLGAHLPTRTRARTVCSSPCLCPGTGVPWARIPAAGRFLPSQGIGRGVGGTGETEVGAPTSAPPPSRSCTPHPCPSAMPAASTHRAEGLGPAEEGTRGQTPGAPYTAAATTEVPAPAHGQSLALGNSSWVQPVPLLHVLRPRAAPGEGTAMLGRGQGLPPPGEGLEGLGWWWVVLKSLPRLWVLGLAAAAPSPVLAAGIAFLLHGLPLGRVPRLLAGSCG